MSRRDISQSQFCAPLSKQVWLSRCPRRGTIRLQKIIAISELKLDCHIISVIDDGIVVQEPREQHQAL
jgi:hypothetical protein